ncbi:MAG: hypothetical protein ABR985_21795 [Methanotrichaceae archaeon]
MMPYNRIVTRKQHNRVSGGPTSIHDALFFSKGPNTLVMAWIPPSARLKAGQKRIQHWNFTQRPFYGNPNASPDAGSVTRLVPLGFVAASRSWRGLKT